MLKIYVELCVYGIEAPGANSYLICEIQGPIYFGICDNYSDDLAGIDSHIQSSITLYH